MTEDQRDKADRYLRLKPRTPSIRVAEYVEATLAEIQAYRTGFKTVKLHEDDWKELIEQASDKLRNKLEHQIMGTWPTA